MLKYKSLLFVSILSTLYLFACQNQQKITPQETTQTSDSLTALYHESAQVLFTARPASATMLGIDATLAGNNFNSRLANFSPESEQSLRKNLITISQQLQNIQTFAPDENKQVMQNLTRYFAGNENFDVGYIDTWMGLSAFIVNQINGPLIDVPNAMITNQAINTPNDANDYLKRLDHFDVFVEHILAKVSADEEKNWVPPLVIVNKSIATMKAFIKPEPQKHPFVQSFEKKINKLYTLSSAQKKNLIKRAKYLVINKVYPSYQNVINTLEQLAMSAPEESGIWIQPGGQEFYKDAVKMLGDTDLTPAQIHQLGLNEVKRITQEMNAIFNAQGMTNGTIGERMSALNDDPKFLYEDTERGRKQLIKDINGYIKDISDRMDEQFATRPKYAVEVRKIPKSREASAPGGMYTNPPIDGSAPGIYWINLRDIKANPKFDLKTLTYHEAIPGHHWQVALNLEQDSLPMLRRIAPYNAYVEGWALYSEKVAAEMGMYENDSFSDLGRLKAELFRAVRLVVDTGLHYKKWSREQAISYMATTTGTVESDVVAEIERYMVWPGQALGYKLGMINILKLRQEAQENRGSQFDIKAFHDLILLGGAVPMEVLNRKVKNWYLNP